MRRLISEGRSTLAVVIVRVRSAWCNKGKRLCDREVTILYRNVTISKFGGNCFRGLGKVHVICVNNMLSGELMGRDYIIEDF